MTQARGIAVGEYYHIYNRGAHKKSVFLDSRDYARFLFLLIHLQSPVQFTHTGRFARTFDQREGFTIGEDNFDNIMRARYVELVSFCIMPNHYHLIIRELIEGGVARYMQRVGNAYSKYIHSKYDQNGHVFQGAYKAKLISDNEYLTHLSAYIHRNPRELKAWKNREAEYPWSSYRDYVTENRWGGLLAQEIILDQFDGTKESNYVSYVKSNPAKELELDFK